MTIEAPKSARHIAFCERVIAGEKLSDSWAGSALDVGNEPGTRAASNVSGSRMAARYADFIAAGKMERAQARADNAQPVTRESIHSLLESVTTALMDASKAASRAGADGISQQLHKVILLHSGRQHRVDARAPAKLESGPSFDSDHALEALRFCDCHE